jgi:hypothetical protein
MESNTKAGLINECFRPLLGIFNFIALS